MPFEKGESGNPAGRPRGSRNPDSAADGKFAELRGRGDRAQGGRDGNKRRYGGHSPVHGSPRASAKRGADRVRVATTREARRQRRGGGDAGCGGSRGGSGAPRGRRAAPRDPR